MKIRRSECKLTTAVRADRVLVSFEDGRRKEWSLPDKADKKALKKLHSEIDVWLQDNRASHGQVEAVKKKLNEEGWYLHGPRNRKPVASLDDL